ncbi:hypothetical protein ACFL59_03100 [Planctomycetota bacterium]
MTDAHEPPGSPPRRQTRRLLSGLVTLLAAIAVFCLAFYPSFLCRGLAFRTRVLGQLHHLASCIQDYIDVHGKPPAGTGGTLIENLCSHLARGGEPEPEMLFEIGRYAARKHTLLQVLRKTLFTTSHTRFQFAPFVAVPRPELLRGPRTPLTELLAKKGRNVVFCAPLPETKEGVVVLHKRGEWRIEFVRRDSELYRKALEETTDE